MRDSWLTGMVQAGIVLALWGASTAVAESLDLGASTAVAESLDLGASTAVAESLDLGASTAVAQPVVLGVPTVVAQPMDLADPTPRVVAVRFEVSPPDRPGQTDIAYSRPFSAWLEPGEEPDEIRVVIDGGVVERQLLTGHEPVLESFSDFVWRFDARSGQVRQAELAGRLVRDLGWGIRVEMPMRVHMDTRRQAGFEPPRRLLGHQYHGFCDSGPAEGCTAVQPRSYDRTTGYVNAVGDIVVSSGPLRVHSFSPLGEAIFSELPPGTLWRAGPAAPAIHVSAPPPTE